jgi:hypothetical protein
LNILGGPSLHHILISSYRLLILTIISTLLQIMCKSILDNTLILLQSKGFLYVKEHRAVMKSSRLYCSITLVSLLLSVSMVTLPIHQGFDIQQKLQHVFAASFIDPTTDFRKAPTAVSGDNIYVSWWSNKTGNDEVLFRSSTDGGATFGDKINLSNTTNLESVDAMVDADGDTVIVTWWERNNTANEPVMRISNDAGQTFGPMLQLAHNETLNTSSEEEQR